MYEKTSEFASVGMEHVLAEVALRGVRDVYEVELVNGTTTEKSLSEIRENLRDQLEHIQLYHCLPLNSDDVVFAEIQIEATGSAVDVYTKIGPPRDFVVIIIRYHWGTNSFTYHLDSHGSYKSVSHPTQPFNNPTTITSALHRNLIRKIGMEEAKHVAKSIQKRITALGISPKDVVPAGQQHPALLD